MAVATKNAMSKIYDRYIELKNKDSDKIYLFLCGNFYIALDSDAIILNELFGMKLTSNIYRAIVRISLLLSDKKSNII